MSCPICSGNKVYDLTIRGGKEAHCRRCGSLVEPERIADKQLKEKLEQKTEK